VYARTSHRPVQQPSFRTAAQRREQFRFFGRHVGTLITFPQKVPLLHATVFDRLTVNDRLEFSGQSAHCYNYVINELECLYWTGDQEQNEPQKEKVEIPIEIVEIIPRAKSL